METIPVDPFSYSPLCPCMRIFCLTRQCQVEYLPQIEHISHVVLSVDRNQRHIRFDNCNIASTTHNLRMRVPRCRVSWALPSRSLWSQKRTPGVPSTLFRRHVPASVVPGRAPAHLRNFSSSRPKWSMIGLDADSTIYALSTAPGRAAIAVVRVSGPACVSV